MKSENKTVGQLASRDGSGQDAHVTSSAHQDGSAQDAHVSSAAHQTLCAAGASKKLSADSSQSAYVYSGDISEWQGADETWWQQQVKSVKADDAANPTQFWDEKVWKKEYNGVRRESHKRRFGCCPLDSIRRVYSGGGAETYYVVSHNFSVFSMATCGTRTLHRTCSSGWIYALVEIVSGEQQRQTGGIGRWGLG